MPEAVEVFRRGRSEFRVERKAFATLEGPADTVAVLSLTSEQQAMFMHAAARTFASAPGGWGRLGSTNILLTDAKEAMVKSAVELAWRNVAPKSLLKRIDGPTPAPR
jgi:hypothetical protein